MNISQSFRLLTLAGLLASPTLTLKAQNQNLLANGSFETGDLTGWNQTPAASGSFFGVDGPDSSTDYGFLTAYDGGDYAFFSAYGGQSDTIDQIVSTTPGTTYEINFWVNDSSSADFTATWDGTTLTQLSPSDNTVISGNGNGGWADFDFTVTAASTTTDLAFAADSSNVLGLDGVSVAPVPEPTSLALAGITSGCLALVGYFRRSLGQAAR